MPTPTHITLLYDGHCTGCTRAANWFLDQQALVPLDAISLHDRALIAARFAPLRLPDDQFVAVAQFADGRVEAHEGGDGWWLALWSLKRFRSLAEKLDRANLRPLARRAYALAAANRFWMSRLLFGSRALTCCLNSDHAEQTERESLTCALHPLEPAMNTQPKIILAGGSGFLGTALTKELLKRNFQIVILTRGAEKNTHGGRVRFVRWDAKTPGPWAKELDGAAAIINTVGRTVDCRKTPANKRDILESRVHSVQALAAAHAQVKQPPKVWVQFATAHIHGDTGDEILGDDAPIGQGFAPEVGLAWEKALTDTRLPDCRQVVLRISFVIGNGGGALPVLARITRLCLGGTVGSGRQYMSWLHVDDLNAMILRALDDEKMSGTYLATAPGAVTNRDFMAQLRRVLHRPLGLPTPEPLLRIGTWFLRTDPELVLLGRRLMPTRLLKEGFVFKHPTLPEALEDLLGKTVA